ncbi:hypothetical protein CA13_74070 [Planctomycetes bacterium CA13]|uniref:DUF4303 domain-containing protein n=1 Tax=Novipirellula herctigrandis TaxID=2527986 RepID=A0A5C5YIK8_9BACT|nr:hypothetical protein CA13_74070 [Planctomycetes bacterium CA13]
MTDIHNDLRRAIVDAIRRACADMANEFGHDPIHGFALCTDDNVMTLYSAACTKSWVAERKPDDKGIGSNYTEWVQNAGDQYFDSVSKTISVLAESDRSTIQQRFECLTLALEDCRKEGLFDPGTLLLCGSTGGVGEMELEAVDRVNTAEAAIEIAEDLSEDHFRDNQNDSFDLPAEKPVRRDTSPLPLMEIIPGRGVDGCEIGVARETAREVFGPTESTSASYLEFPEVGVEVICRRKIVQTLIFYFRLNDYGRFNGLTREGIGANNSVDDVLKTYGKPSRTSESTVSEFGAAPGAREKSIEYNNWGITFKFWDGQLADIRVDEMQS